jgi:hypothetical protein
MPRRNLKFESKLAREVEKAKVIGSRKGNLSMDKLEFNANNIGLQIKKKLIELDPSASSKFIATIGVMVQIHNGIVWSRDILAAGSWAAQFASSFLLPSFLGGRNIFDLEAPIPAGEPSIADEILAWLISYGIAYLIVENFGEIVTALATGLQSIVGIAKTMLGASLVPA